MANEVVEAEERCHGSRNVSTGTEGTTALALPQQLFVHADSEMQTGFTNLAMSALDLYAHSPESHEGAAAFAEKRDPDFSSFDNAY